MLGLPKQCYRKIVCQGSPVLSTYSLTSLTVSVYPTRKPNWNMPEHASINPSATVTHEDFFPRRSTLAGGRGLRVRRWMTVNISVPRGHYVWNVARCSHLKTIHTRRPAQDERSGRVRRSEAVTSASGFDCSSTGSVSLTSAGRRRTSKPLMSQSRRGRTTRWRRRQRL